MNINVLQLLERCADTWPDRIALEDDIESLTYSDYREYAKRIGSFLAQNVCGGKRNSPVAVLIDRNVRTVYTFAGIVYSGNFYVPIDMAMPIERIRLILDSLQPLAIIDARNDSEQKEDIYTVDYILENAIINESLLRGIRNNAIDVDPLYAIFTSGSTGVPKGVLVSHRSVIDLTEAFHHAFAFKDGTVFGNQAPFDFDVSTKDIYNSLYCGGCVTVIPKKCFAAPKLLGEYLTEKRIETLIWAVSALRIIADFKVFDKMDTLPCLQNVMFSGEVMPLKTLRYWIEKMPEARYVNLYGPTEITCNCTYYVVDNAKVYTDKLPIGHSFVNTRVFLRDECNGIITEEEKIGEICVEGTCLALGYWGDKEKTEAVFRKVPTFEKYNSMMYATGDMGYFGNDGELYFASRRDHQIKHMGHRIELGEIEAALNEIPFLTISVCIYDEQRQKIVCFYQAEKECKKEIVLELAKKLQKYMWPNVYKLRETLPMTKNGKIDRVLLKKEWEAENGTVD